jgi:hypothetical protein
MSLVLRRRQALLPAEVAYGARGFRLYDQAANVLKNQDGAVAAKSAAIRRSVRALANLNAKTLLHL